NRVVERDASAAAKPNERIDWLIGWEDECIVIHFHLATTALSPAGFGSMVCDTCVVHRVVSNDNTGAADRIDHYVRYTLSRPSIVLDIVRLIGSERCRLCPRSIPR